MKSNPLKKLESLGQSVWLDYISKDLFAGGRLRRLIEEDGISGLTSNPAIFEAAIAGGTLYDADIELLAGEGKGPEEIYETLARRDVQAAADALAPVYEKTAGRDGYVSLEVNPALAHDTAGTIREARRLWGSLARPNVMIKIPATDEGLPAVRQLTGEGLNINVTLLFGLPRYRQAAGAYLAGLGDRLRRGEPVDRVASVASVFLSRIDSLADPLIDAYISHGKSIGQAEGARGRTAVCSAKAAYGVFKELFRGPAFALAAAKGARPQRLLWASTGTKDPAYSDVKYLEPLIGPDTVTTVPVRTLDAYRAHGAPRATLEKDTDEAMRFLLLLPELGVYSGPLALELEAQGLEKFEAPFGRLLETLRRRAAAGAGRN
jgi:transaldolase